MASYTTLVTQTCGYMHEICLFEASVDVYIGTLQYLCTRSLNTLLFSMSNRSWVEMFFKTSGMGPIPPFFPVLRRTYTFTALKGIITLSMNPS